MNRHSLPRPNHDSPRRRPDEARVYHCLSCRRYPSGRRRPQRCPFCGSLRLKFIGCTTRDMLRDGEYDQSLAKVPAALKYLQRGWSVIPVVLVDGKKRPLVAWKEYQGRLPTEKEIRTWWGEKWPHAGIAVVCGPISGVYVLDVDPRNGGSLDGKSLPQGPLSKTLNGGCHHFFRGEVPLGKRQGILPGVDFQGEGSYAVLPPSFGRYEWTQELDGELPELPRWVVDLIPAGDNRPPRMKKEGKPQLPRLSLLVTDVVRFLQELNRKCIELKLCWPAIMWSELRTFSQLDGGSGFLVFDDAFSWLLERGYDYYLIFQILEIGEGIFWDRRRGGRRSGIRLRSLKAVCKTLGVKIRFKAHWQTIPLADFHGKQKLAHFCTVAAYDSIDRRADPKFRPISRRRIRERSGVSPSRQLRCDRILGLLNGKRRKCGGKACYEPNPKKEKEGDPDYLQEPSFHWSLARLGPKGCLLKVRGALLRDGSRKKPEGADASDAALHPRRYFDDDAEYEKLAEKCPVDPDPMVVLPDEERRCYRPVRRSVSLWREPLAVSVSV